MTLGVALICGVAVASALFVSVVMLVQDYTRISSVSVAYLVGAFGQE